MTVLAKVCHISGEMKIAVAALLGVPGAASLTEKEQIAAITNAVMKLTHGEHDVLTRVRKLLSVKEVEKLSPRHKPTQVVTVKQELRLNFTSYASFRRQVEGALQKGYSDQEVQDALLNALPTDMPLKQYLEVADLDLSGMCRLVQQYFNEPSPTELFITLTNATQKQEESAANFMMRLMHDRERMKLAAKLSKEDSYPTSLVESTYRRALETGLSDMEMRVTTRDLLDKKASDEEILAELNKLTAASHGRNHEPLKKAAIPEERDKTTNRQNETEEVLEQLVARIQVLEAEREGREVQGKYKCERCRRQNIQRCSHCWRCGSSAHFERDCKKSDGRRKQGNGNRPR